MNLEEYLAENKPETLVELLSSVTEIRDDTQIRIINKERLEIEMEKSRFINKEAFANSHLYIFNYADFKKMNNYDEICNYKIEDAALILGRLYVIVKLSKLEYGLYLLDQTDKPKNVVFNYQGMLDFWDSNYSVYDKFMQKAKGDLLNLL